MKLEKYENKLNKKRNIIFITLGVIVLISVSFLLYKTFASFTENVSFPIMEGKVDYFGNSDVYFVFYKSGRLADEMPQKGNNENYEFVSGSCNNGASIEWNESEWAPLVKNLSKPKTKCSLYFDKQIKLDRDIPIVTTGSGLYKVEHNDLKELDNAWSKTEYRYAGNDENVNNYVRFNEELWRIIGLVNVKTENGVEQRIKIVKTRLDNYSSFGSFIWDTTDDNWTDSKLKDMLNGIYYNSDSGDCYKIVSELDHCDFSGNGYDGRGLNAKARDMVDDEVIWNLGGYDSVSLKADEFYEKERGTITPQDYYTKEYYPSEWSKKTDIGNNFNGIALIYPSDSGYSIGGNVRENCLSASFNNQECMNNAWLSDKGYYLNTLTPFTDSNYNVFTVDNYGINFYGIDGSMNIWPTLYLKSSVKIKDGSGSQYSPFELSNE